MKGSLALAFALMLLFEGIIPFLFPRQWRNVFHRIAAFSDGQVRFFGLLLLIFGLVVLGLVCLFS